MVLTAQNNVRYIMRTISAWKRALKKCMLTLTIPVKLPARMDIILLMEFALSVTSPARSVVVDLQASVLLANSELIFLD